MDITLTNDGVAGLILGVIGVVLGWLLKRPNKHLELLIIAQEVVSAVQRYLATASDEQKRQAAVMELRRLRPDQTVEQATRAIEQAIERRRAVAELRGWRDLEQ